MVKSGLRGHDTYFGLHLTVGFLKLNRVLVWISLRAAQRPLKLSCERAGSRHWFDIQRPISSRANPCGDTKRKSERAGACCWLVY